MFDSAALRARLSACAIASRAPRAGPDATLPQSGSSPFPRPSPSDYIRAAADAGQLDFGENKVQEGLQKMQETADLPLRWHLIGHLQSNKAKKAAEFHAIHSIDAAALLLEGG